MYITCNFCEFCVFGIFLETAWQTVHSRQATHAFLACFWFPEEESPGGTPLAVKQLMTVTQILGFWLNCLAEMNFRQATRVILG